MSPEGSPLRLIAGPCLAESLDLCRIVAEKASDTAQRLGMPYTFKASFDKANRTSINTDRGQGLDAGLAILSKISNEFGVPVTTDIHLPDQAKQVAEVCDIIQIPAFLCRQTDLLAAAAETGKIVNVKKGQFLAPWDTKNIVEKLRALGASGIILTERGTSFGYNNLVVDMAGLSIMRSYGVPVCFDATHSAQRPGGQGESSGGARENIPTLARAAVAAGIDYLFLETHPTPEKAASDSATQWPVEQLGTLLKSLSRIHDSVS